MSTNPLTVLFAVVVLLALYLVNWKIQRSKLPPGPPRLPLLGNLLQAPSGAPWVTFQKWVDQYGPLVAADFGGTNVIIIGDYETARDLLDKRANIYSSRPRMVMAHELVCKRKLILFKEFNDDFLLHQRLDAPVLSPRASACYTPIQDLESKQLLRNLLDSNDVPKQFGRYAASIIYSLTFGLRIITGEEWQIKTSHECLNNVVVAGQVGAWIVDALPFLNYLPAPFTPWKHVAEAWHQKWANLFITNLRDALNREGWNWAKDFKNAKETQCMTDMELAWNIGGLCDAGVETSDIQLQVFILACLVHPDWIPKAQAELDRVVGSDRLPDFHDIENLPYIQAVVEENFRWRHIIPAGVPHATTKADHYKGYLIPKGSVIVPLFKAMREDNRHFEYPERFIPERWIGKSQPSNFGYGRRICPGRFIGRNSVTIAIARLLWAFNIRSKEKIVVDESMFTTGFISGPKPFPVVFEPRSESHRRIIEESYDATEKDVVCLMNEARKKQVSVGLNPRG